MKVLVRHLVAAEVAGDVPAEVGVRQGGRPGKQDKGYAKQKFCTHVQIPWVEIAGLTVSK